MESHEFFLNAGMPPQALHFEPISTSSSMPIWQSLSSPMEIQVNEPNHSTDHLFHSNWEKSTDHSPHFDSALSSMVPSPAVSNSNMSNQSLMIREVIGKLGNIGNNNNTSCYTTPMNSPPKLIMPVREQLNFPSFGKPMALNSSVAELITADPGFAERAAKFSCFGSRSFNGRTSQLVLNNAELANRCNPLVGNGKLARVSSSPSLKAVGSQKGQKSSPLLDRSELTNSQESSVSEQIPNEEEGLNASSELNSRKRKAISKGKEKEPASNPPANATKDAETDDNSDMKRIKLNDRNENENSPVKAEEDDKQNKANSKSPDPPKDYIHVRARRGQATDSHSLAERVRREKISERMKLLQDLVPGCNKVTGKTLMLDEIINYVQSLQRQVEILSMKLASVNTRLDSNMDTLISKDIFQPSHPLPHPIFPLDSSASTIFGHQPQQNLPLHSNISNGTVTQCSVDPLDTTGLCQNLNIQLPPLDGFTPTVHQYPTFCEDDLHTIVQMGFVQNPNTETTFLPQNFHGSNQVSHMKIEL